MEYLNILAVVHNNYYQLCEYCNINFALGSHLVNGLFNIGFQYFNPTSPKLAAVTQVKSYQFAN